MTEDESGFTLVELLLSMAVLTIIVGSIVAALGVYFTTSGDTSRRDDHSGGVAVAGSYLNRDLASADTVATSGNTCSGVINTLSLTWTEWNSTIASPVPTASGGMWAAAYALVSYTNTNLAGQPTRWELRRWYCPPGVTNPPPPTVVLANLASTADVTVKVANSSSCAGTQVSVIISRYVADVGSNDSLAGCVKGRLS